MLRYELHTLASRLLQQLVFSLSFNTPPERTFTRFSTS